MNLENKRIVLTGATSGIGLETLKLLQKFQGTRIIAVGRKIELIPQHENVIPYKCDVSQEKEVDALFQFALEKMNGIDIFIANAGFGYYEKMNKPDWAHIEHIYQTNVFSPLYSYQKMVALNPENPFSFIATASAVALYALPYYTIYSSTKYALNGFLDGIQYELPKNAHVGLVYPVATKTKFFQTSSISTQGKEIWPTQTPDKVALAIVKGILKNKRKIMPSTIFYFSAIIGKFFPGIIRLAMKKQVEEPGTGR
jgi:short-subunit dehydrogenase